MFGNGIALHYKVNDLYNITNGHGGRRDRKVNAVPA
jgi:hypothetical protein